MAKGSKLIWRINTRDEVYTGVNGTYLMAGASAGEVEKRALARAAKMELAKGESNPKPYISSIEFVGELDE